MTKHTSWAIALTATTFLSAPAMAVSLTPTLDNLKSEAGIVLPSVNDTYDLTELSGDLPEGAVKVKIGDKNYYFTPSGDDAGLLTTLAGTSAGMLKESSDGLFELDGKKYGFDVASIPDSAFSYSEGSKDDYNFTVQEADAEGNLTTKYYKIDLKPEAFATSQNISWTAVDEDQRDAADVVAVQLPNNRTKYFKYTYTQPEGRTVYNTHQDALSGDVDADFIGSKVTEDYGGAIYNNGTIGNITGDFIGNYTQSSSYYSDTDGGAVSNNGAIGNISGRFVNNYVQNLGSGNSSEVRGGAIYNGGTIGDITGDFIGNYAKISRYYSGAYGGAIYNAAAIGDITGDLIGNYVSGYFANGGAIYNNGTIGNITGDLIGNYGKNSGSSTYGGAILNKDKGTIGNITGDLIGNYSSTHGGAIYNYGIIGDIQGDFIANSAELDGGAIDGSGTIGTITGNFIANSAGRDGGAIMKTGSVGKISSISSDFIGNFSKECGGAIYNSGTIGNISSNFIGNYAKSGSGYYSYTHGGGIYNDGSINNITSNFIGNYVQDSGSGHYSGASGGAIQNYKKIDNITGDFLKNSAQILSGTKKAEGGAIWTRSNITFTSGAKTHFFSGNYTKDLTRGKIYNAMFGEIYNSGTPEITFDTAGGGAWVINDNLENGEYVFKGDDVIDAAIGTTTQYVAMNNDIINAETVTVEGTTLKFGAYQHEDQTAKNWDSKGAFVASLNEDGTANRDAAAVTNLSLNNGVFDIANGYLETVKLKSYSATDSFMHIDVDPDNMKADELHVAGNVEGVTKLIVHASSDADIRGKGEILFAQSENDTTGNAGSFVVSRVYKSPYLFDVKYNQIADNSNKWYFEMNDQPNEEPKEPDVPDVPTPPTPELPDIPPVKPQPLPGSDRPVAPEVIGAESLPAAGLAQTSNMIYNIMQKVSSNRFYCPGCGFYDYYWNGEAFHNLWANAVYNTLRIKTPTDIDAEVWGLEAGGDLQHDLNNKLGLFLSYRKGNYDMNGDGKHHYSTIGSEIDIDSYLAGLYYRYDRNHWWTFATVYGGIQRVDLKTKDGIKSDTDGTEFGGSVELGYDYNLSKTLYLTPSIGAFYTQVDYDDATDSAGKIAKYNTLRQLELEAGVKLTKAFVTDEGYANVYVKPSVVRTLTDGDEVNITGLGKVNTLDDQTLGRVELGGRYGFTEQLSAYGWANHTFGDDYKASTFGLGLSYSW